MLVQLGSKRLSAIFRLLMSSPRRSKSYHTGKHFPTPTFFVIQLLVLWKLTEWYPLLQNTETIKPDKFLINQSWKCRPIWKWNGVENVKTWTLHPRDFLKIQFSKDLRDLN